MATEVLELIINVRGAQQGAQQFNRLERSVSGVRSALNFLRSALVVFASIRAFSGIVTLIDSFTEITTKLKLVTSTTAELNAVTQKLFEISQETRTGFEDNVTLFNRVARATTALNLNFKQLLDTSRTVAQLMKISGATTQEASGGLIQFAQGLASGRLSGDELRTVLEQLPRLADVIGREFGLAGAQLRALANSNPGIISTERIMRALANAAVETTKEFGNVLPTIADGFTLVSNALTIFIGRLNQASGIGAKVFELLAGIARNIDLVVTGLLLLTGLTVFNLLASQALFFAQTIGGVGGAVFRLFNFMLFSVGTLIKAFTTLGFHIVAALSGGAIGGGSALIGVLRSIGAAATGAAFAIVRVVAAVLTFVVPTAVYAMTTGFVNLLVAIDRVFLALGPLIARMTIVIGLSIGSATLGAATGFRAMAAAALTAAAAVARFILAMSVSAVIEFAYLIGTGLVGAFRLLTSAVITLTVRFAVLTVAMLSNPVFLGMAAVVAGIVLVWYLFGDSISKLIEKFGSLRNIVNNILAFLQTTGQILFNSFDLLWKSVAEGFFNAFQTIKKTFSDFIDFISRSLKTVSFGQIDFGEFKFEKVASEYAGSAEKLAKLFSEKFKENLNADPLRQIETAAADTFKFLKSLLTGGQIDEEALLGKPKAGVVGTVAGDADNKIARFTNQIEAYLARISPFFDVNAKIDRLKTLFLDAAAAGVNVPAILAKIGATQEEVFSRITREELGVGNALTDYVEKLNLYDQALQNNDITQREWVEQTRAARIELLSFSNTVSSGIESAFLKLEDGFSKVGQITEDVVTSAVSSSTALRLLAIQTKALNEANAQGKFEGTQFADALRAINLAALPAQRDLASGIKAAVLGIEELVSNEKSIAQGVVERARAARTALAVYAVQVKALNEALADGTLRTIEYTQSMRDFTIEVLRSQTDAASGLLLGVLEIQKSLENMASAVAGVVTRTFKGLEDALVNFITTGKLSFQSFIDGLVEDMARLTVQQFIIKPIIDFIVSKFPGLGGPAKNDGSSSDRALWVRITDAAGSIADKTKEAFGGVSPVTEVLSDIPDFIDVTPAQELPGSETFLQRMGDIFRGEGGGFLSGLVNALRDGANAIGRFIANILTALSGGGGGEGVGGKLLGLGLSLLGAAGGGGSATYNTSTGNYTPGPQGFASGGSFMVGGDGSTDSQLVAFRASPDERVTVETPQQQNKGQKGGGAMVQHNKITFVLPGVTDEDDFRASASQTAAKASRKLDWRSNS